MARKATVKTGGSQKARSRGDSSAAKEARAKARVSRSRTNVVEKGKVASRERRAVRSYDSAASYETNEHNTHDLVRDGLAVLCGIAGVIVTLAVVSELFPQFGDFRINNGIKDESIVAHNIMGPLGHVVARIFVELFGWTALLVVIMSIVFAYRIYVENGTVVFLRKRIIRSIASLFFVLSCSSIIAILFGASQGGFAGVKLANMLVSALNDGGALLVSCSIMVLTCKLTFGSEGKAAIKKSASRAKEIVITSAENTKVACNTGVRWASCMFQIISGIFKGLFFALMVPTKVLVRLGVVLLVVLKAIAKLIRGHNNDAAICNVESPKGVIALRPKNALALTYSGSSCDDVSPRIVKTQPVKIPSTEQIESLERNRKKAIVQESSGRKGLNGKFVLPSLELLVSGSQDTSVKLSDDELLRNSKLLEKALTDFKIGGNIVEVQPGPVITLYQFEPAPGIKVQRIVSLADDLALALKVASVRVYAPVPGKGTVGIEVPNSQREIVRLRDVLGSSEFIQSKARLVLALGKDTFGDPFVAELSKMPHLLIAGATGTGKSVCINSLLLSLLYRNTPQDLRLLLIDPKMLELSVYEGIPHLKSPVITNPKRARGVLWWAVEEMERRYNLMKDLGVRNLASYNRAILQGNKKLAAQAEDFEAEADLSDEEDNSFFEGDAPSSKTIARTIKNGGLTTLPRIVIVVDELADLMLTVGKEIEELLTRLAQKARASGIHLIIATQRPSVNVITGLIKANFPTRISFQVASRIDSRTVLDTSGSERLLGMGDMLYMSPGVGRLKRMHSAYVSDGEVQEVVDSLLSQGSPDYDPEIEEIITRFEESEKPAWGPSGEEEYDPLYDQAVQLVVDKGMASTSLVQRVFRIGYNRAARILETMEREGLVGPADGAKPRQVLVPNRMNDL